MERYSWAVGIDENTGLITVEDARLSISSLVTPAGAITSRGGLIPAAAEPGAVTATSPTPNGFVHVSPFRAVRQSTRGGGTYIWCLDEIKSLDVLTAAPPDPAQARIVLVVWQQNDTFFGDADSDFDVRLVVGAPGSPPVDPAVPGSSEYTVRARITVPANATTITNANIQLLPLPWTVSTGGVLPVRDQAERDAIVNPYDGFAVWRIDQGWLEVHDGTAFRVQGLVETDNLAKITHPRTNQLVLRTTDMMVYRHNGTAWVSAIPISGTTAATRHEAYYYQSGTPQNMPATDQRILFNSNLRTTSDITTTTVDGGTEFTFQRAGWWDIDLSAKTEDGPNDTERYLALADSDNLNRRYAQQSGPSNTATLALPIALSVSKGRPYNVGDTVCALMFVGEPVALLNNYVEDISISFSYRGQ